MLETCVGSLAALFPSAQHTWEQSHSAAKSKSICSGQAWVKKYINKQALHFIIFSEDV